MAVRDDLASLLHAIDFWVDERTWPTDEELTVGRSMFDTPPTAVEFRAEYEAAADVILALVRPAILEEACQETLGDPNG